MVWANFRARWEEAPQISNSLILDLYVSSFPFLCLFGPRSKGPCSIDKLLYCNFTLSWKEILEKQLGVIHIWRPLWGELRQKWDVNRRSRVGVSECSGRPTFIFFIKENWICAMTRHAEPDINILLTRNLPFDSIMSDSEAIHCIVCGLNRTRECVVNLNVTWLGFAFVLISFVHMYGAVVQVVQIKQVYYKLSTPVPKCQTANFWEKLSSSFKKSWYVSPCCE